MLTNTIPSCLACDSAHGLEAMWSEDQRGSQDHTDWYVPPLAIALGNLEIVQAGSGYYYDG